MKASVLVGALLCSGVVLTLDSHMQLLFFSSGSDITGSGSAVAAFTISACVLRFS